MSFNPLRPCTANPGITGLCAGRKTIPQVCGRNRTFFFTFAHFLIYIRRSPHAFITDDRREQTTWRCGFVSVIGVDL